MGPISRGELDLTAAGARLLHAISAASIGAGSHIELDAAVREFVAELRDANEPPEQVLLGIKRILAQAGLRPSHPPTDPAMVVERLAERVSHCDRVEYPALFRRERRRGIQRLGRHFVEGDVVLALERPPQSPRVLEQNQRIPLAS